VTREQVYGRRPVRETLRGRREVLELWATERAQKSEAWLRDLDRPRVQTKLERELSEASGTRDHQGVLAWCEPYKYADGWELASVERPLLVCLDQVTDPRNLGAVIRSADGAGATGVVDGARPMWDTDLSGGVALVLGAEGKGLRPLVRKTCDELVSIPMSGSVESLNVSVAAALLLYEANRQRSV
jgi:23S rRNA (guanosine2251-2'-O)-methyltransferase